MLRTNTKPHHLIKHTKISYSIASLVFRKVSYRTYRNGLNQVPQSWGTLSISKSTNRVSSIPFVENPHFSVLLHRVLYLKIYLCLEGNRSSFSRVSLKSEKFSSLSERNYFLKTKISRQTTWRWIILCLMLNSWKWINWGNLATPLKVSRKCS